MISPLQTLGVIYCKQVAGRYGCTFRNVKGDEGEGGVHKQEKKNHAKLKCKEKDSYIGNHGCIFTRDTLGACLNFGGVSFSS